MFLFYHKYFHIEYIYGILISKLINTIVNDIMNQPKISIIVPFYNLELYVERCLNSLVNQTFSAIEILCINDGSTDNTLNILETFAKTDNRIKIITQKNSGVSSARNTGIKNAKGDFLLFIDGDDYIELNACELLYEKALETDADMICFWRRFVFGNGYIKNISIPVNTYIAKQPFLFYDYYFETFLLTSGCYMCDRLYKKSFLAKHHLFFKENISWREDSLFIYEALLANPKIYITNYILYNYYVLTSNSLSKIKNEKFIQNCIQHFYNINEICLNNNLPNDSLIKSYMFNSLLNSMACTSFFRALYRTNLNTEITAILLNIMDSFKYLDKVHIDKMKGYKKFRIYYLFLIKFHLCYIYCFLIYPIIKLINQLYIIYFGNKTTNMTKI